MMRISKGQKRCIASALVLVWLFAGMGCGLMLGAKRADKEYYVLNDDGSAPQQTLESSPLRLLVRDAKGDGFINSQKIIFSEDPTRRGYYQLAQWVQPPPERFTLLLMERLERAKVFAAVSRLASSSLGDIQVNTEILDFYHDIADMPGKTVVRINAELVDLRSRTIVGSRQFSETVEVKAYDAEGAVKAFAKAVNKILNEMTAWLAEQAKTAVQKPQ